MGCNEISLSFSPEVDIIFHILGSKKKISALKKGHISIQSCTYTNIIGKIVDNKILSGPMFSMCTRI